MRFNRCVFELSTLVLLVAVPRLALAAESYGNCKGFIASVPAVISTPGTWCLSKNLSTVMYTGKAITIATNNVTIDCNDFKVDGLGAGAGTTAFGVYALNRFGATIRHCKIRGFYKGVFFDGTGGGRHVIEDNLFDGNTYAAIWLQGDNSVIQRNQIFNSGGTTTGAAMAYGIRAPSMVDIFENTVSGVTGGGGSTWGIWVTDGTTSDNRVTGIATGGGCGSAAWGIYGGDRPTLRRNIVVDAVGLGCAGAGLACINSWGQAKDNVIKGFATGISLCSNDGGNVITP